MARAEDMNRYYRISCDTRDLNYALFFEKGERSVSEREDYTSANTYQLSDDELRAMLLKLDFVQEELRADHGRQGSAIKTGVRG
jgi:UDP-glucose 4-epimerase